MSMADEIRKFTYYDKIAPALDAGDAEVRIRAGDIHSLMGLQNRLPAVCAALGAKTMETRYGVTLINRDGPHAGANVFFRFGRVVDVKDRSAASPKSVLMLPTTPANKPTFTADAVYLVACVKTKRTTPTMARDLYVSDWFKSARSFVESRDALWFILSAEYGLVGPDEMITPYEKSLKAQSVFERRRWARDVNKRLFALVPTVKKVVMLAGDAYAQFLIEQLQSAGVSVERPMEGLRQGEQLGWLKRQ